jgi:hypothetical protein
MGAGLRKCATPYRGSAHGRAGVNSVKPALRQGHRKVRFRRGVMPHETVIAVAKCIAIPTGAGDRTF